MVGGAPCEEFAVADYQTSQGGGDEPTTLVVRTEVTAQSAVVSVAGEVDMDTVAQLEQGVREALARAPGASLVLDFSDVRFFGSAGLTVLLAIDAELKRRGSRFRLVVGTRRTIIRVLEATGLDTVLSIYPTMRDALGNDG
jgi:anti-sigma B factor antagonist